MKLNKINIKGFQSIKEAEIVFSKTNLVTGFNFDANCGNGSGKTTVIYSVLFALFGDKLIDKKLSSLINKSAEFCETDLEFQVNDDIVRVVRRYPTKLELYINGKKSDLIGVAEKQRKIYKLVGDIEQFKKFRIIDKAKGENILDFTSKQLTKTLMGFSEDKFQNIRKKLLSIKSEREKYNKNQVIYKHFPSEKRKQILENGKEEIKLEGSMIEADLESVNDEYGAIIRKEGSLQSEIRILSKQVNDIKDLSTCPTCKQEVKKEYRDSITSKLKKEVEEINKVLTEHLKNKRTVSEKKVKASQELKKLSDQERKINNIIHRLEARFKQLDYKYTEKDILLIKKAIEAIDKFATYYIVQWIKVVEPIVNSYISKLNMNMKFIIDEKQNISIVINRNGKDYLYDELSTGEKLFISFVFNIAILIEQQQTGFLIADEGLDSLSVENLERIFSIIEDTNKQFICVSQHRDLNMKNVNVIYLEKKDDVSQTKGD